MNSNINCNACADLEENAPTFVQNGVTDDVCDSLADDTGFEGEDQTDCEDLDTANDCMVGMMEAEIDSYDICDWKDFMKSFIGNLHQLLKSFVCAICGLWTNIHRLTCEVNYLYEGSTFSIGEETSGDAYAVAGKGVSFLTAVGSTTGEHITDLSLVYIAGGLMRGVGSFNFYNDSFTDSDTVGNFDKGSTYRETSSRLGNSYWGTTGRYASGGELICEFRIKKSAYPQIKTIYSGFGQETGGGAYHVRVSVFTAGQYAYGQHGWCNTQTGAASATGYDDGHLVPTGWIYIQIRMTYCFLMVISGKTDDDGVTYAQYSPGYFLGVRMNQSEIDCD